MGAGGVQGIPAGSFLLQAGIHLGTDPRRLSERNQEVLAQLRGILAQLREGLGLRLPDVLRRQVQAEVFPALQQVLHLPRIVRGPWLLEAEAQTERNPRGHLDGALPLLYLPGELRQLRFVPQQGGLRSQGIEPLIVEALHHLRPSPGGIADQGIHHGLHERGQYGFRRRVRWLFDARPGERAGCGGHRLGERMQARAVVNGEPPRQVRALPVSQAGQELSAHHQLGSETQGGRPIGQIFADQQTGSDHPLAHAGGHEIDGVTGAERQDCSFNWCDFVLSGFGWDIDWIVGEKRRGWRGPAIQSRQPCDCGLRDALTEF